MAQDPHQLDALQIVGDTGTGTRLIEAVDSAGNPEDGAMLLTDAQVPSGIKLANLPGLQQVDRVTVVGEGGLGLSKDSDGMTFTSIQDALDALSAGLTASTPGVIFLAPGTYTENLTVEKDGVEIVGLGSVTLRNSGDNDTLTVSTGVGTPLGFRLRNVRIENDQDGRSCILVDGGIGSTIGTEDIDVADCELVSTGLAGFNLDANTVNTVKFTNVNCSGSVATAIIRARQVANLQLRQIYGASRLIVDYDSGGDIPSVSGSENTIYDSEFSADCSVVLDGVGSLSSKNSEYGDITLGGDQNMSFQNDAMGDLVVNDTVAVERIDGSRGTLTGAAGSSVAERSLRGEASFIASASEVVTFDAPHPDANYTVSLDPELVPAAFTDIPRVTSPLATGFTISFGGSQTTTVRWTVTRNF